MKHLSLLLGALLLSVVSALGAAPPPPALLVTITGTISTQVLIGMTEGRINVDKLDNTRVFEEFRVSPQAYALILDLGGTGSVTLRQKNSGGALPDIVVMTFTGGGSAIDTKAKLFRVHTDLSSTATNTLFEAISGAVQGTLKYEGGFPPSKFRSGSFKAFALGTDPSPDGNGKAQLRFSLKTAGEFRQQ